MSFRSWINQWLHYWAWIGAAGSHMTFEKLGPRDDVKSILTYGSPRNGIPRSIMVFFKDGSKLRVT